jgi:hypothetical protein
MNIPAATQENDLKGSRRNFAGISYRWQLVLFILVHLFIFIVLFHTVYTIQYSATGLYFGFASKVLDGSIPYHDFAFEYPPFSLLFFILPRLGASTWLTFSMYYQAEVIVFDIIGIYIIYKIARKLGNPPWLLLAIYTLCILFMGPIILQQYDLFPAVMSLLAIYLFWTGKHKTAWAILALATLTKIYPAVIAPIFLIHYIRNTQWKLCWQGLTAFGVVCLVILLPFLIIGPASLRTLYDYHALRGIQLESTYSSFLLAADKLNIINVKTAFGFGSWNVLGTAADVLTRSSTYILGILLLLAYSFIFLRTRKGAPEINQLAACSVLVILITLLTSKMLSPQYIIWLIPLLPLVSGRWWQTTWIAFMVVGVLTYYLFPWNYVELTRIENQAVVVLLVRNLLLIAIAVFIFISLLRQPLNRIEEQGVKSDYPAAGASGIKPE